MPEIRVDSNQVRLHYRDVGPSSGPTLVWLHGFPFDSSLWDSQLEAFAAEVRSIALDFRGFGRSELVPGPYEMSRLADDVVDALDALAVERAAIVGLSMGGYVAFELWRRHPEWLRALVLADTRPHPDTPEARASRSEMAELARREGSAAIARRLLPKLLAPENVDGPAAVKLNSMIEAAQPEAIVGALEGMAARADSRPLLNDIAVPVCVIAGEHDALAPPDEARAWSSQIRDSRTEIIPGAGHASNLERPREFNLALSRFLRDAIVTLAGLVTFGLAGCGGIPDPPQPIAPPAPPALPALPADRAHSTGRIEPPRIAAPVALAPALRLHPATPSEGTLFALVLEPYSRGLPLLELRGWSTVRSARATEPQSLELTSLDGGAYLTFVAAPIGAHGIDLEFEAHLTDGSHVRFRNPVAIASRDFPATRLSVSSRFTNPDSAALARAAAERELVRTTLRQISAPLSVDGPFIVPRTDRTTSVFGQRRTFNGELRSRHWGLDIDGDTGDPIYAANDGRVVLARSFYFNGNAVYVDHGRGLFTSYLHLSKFEVSEGQWVEKGQLVGRVGATGRVTGSHLHWGLHLNGTPLDPMSVLDEEFVELLARQQHDIRQSTLDIPHSAEQH